MAEVINYSAIVYSVSIQKQFYFTPLNRWLSRCSFCADTRPPYTLLSLSMNKKANSWAPRATS
jgi:hypothetical protein